MTVKQIMALKEITTQKSEPAPQKSKMFDEKAYLTLKSWAASMCSKISPKEIKRRQRSSTFRATI